MRRRRMLRARTAGMLIEIVNRSLSECMVQSDCEIVAVLFCLMKHCCPNLLSEFLQSTFEKKCCCQTYERKRYAYSCEIILSSKCVEPSNDDETSNEIKQDEAKSQNRCCCELRVYA